MKFNKIKKNIIITAIYSALFSSSLTGCSLEEKQIGDGSAYRVEAEEINKENDESVKENKAILDNIDYEEYCQILSSTEPLCMIPEIIETENNHDICVVSNYNKIYNVPTYMYGVDGYVAVNNKMSYILNIVDDIEKCIEEKNEGYDFWVEPNRIDIGNGIYGLQVPKGYLPYYLGEEEACSVWGKEEFKDTSIYWSEVEISLEDYVGVDEKVVNLINVKKSAVSKMSKTFDNVIQERYMETGINDYNKIIDEIDYSKVCDELMIQYSKCINNASLEKKSEKLTEILNLVDYIKANLKENSKLSVQIKKTDDGFQLPKGYLPYYIGEENSCNVWGIIEHDGLIIYSSEIELFLEDYIGIDENLYKLLIAADSIVTDMKEYSNQLEVNKVKGSK